MSFSSFPLQTWSTFFLEYVFDSIVRRNCQADVEVNSEAGNDAEEDEEEKMISKKKRYRVFEVNDLKPVSGGSDDGKDVLSFGVKKKKILSWTDRNNRRFHPPTSSQVDELTQWLEVTGKDGFYNSEKPQDTIYKLVEKAGAQEATIIASTDYFVKMIEMVTGEKSTFYAHKPRHIPPTITQLIDQQPPQCNQDDDNSDR